MFIVIALLNSKYSFEQTDSANKHVFGIWGHGLITNQIASAYDFYRGWDITYTWKELEPEKGNYNWKYFDDQLKIAAAHHLYIGFMIWTGQNSPEWLYKNGVPEVLMNTDKKYNRFPYYLNAVYKESYLNMLKAVAEHIQALDISLRKNILYWMSAEGSTGDIVPYKGELLNKQYAVSDQQWFDFKTEAWSYMYKFGESLKPKLNIMINPGNNGEYFNWLLENLPDAWMKAGDVSHDYQFNNEQSFYKRLQVLANKTLHDSLVNRIRGECEYTFNLDWFKAAPDWNMYALVCSCLHFGLDIMNVRPRLIEAIKDTFSFHFFNEYAGQKNPSTATGAFCIFRDVLDVADTLRFPVSIFGEYAFSKNKYDSLEDAKNKALPDERIYKIMQVYTSNGAMGNTNFYDKKKQVPGKSDQRGTRSIDKLFNDYGENLVPGNYYRYLTQYHANETSKGYWRVGPKDQPFGRYARGFDFKNGMKEMYFVLDSNFYKQRAGFKSVTIKIIYLNQGNGQWSLNYFNGNGKTEAYKVECTNTGRWLTKEIILSNIFFEGKLENACDVSIKYLSGDNTIFNSIEIIRK